MLTKTFKIARRFSKSTIKHTKDAIASQSTHTDLQGQTNIPVEASEISPRITKRLNLNTLSGLSEEEHSLQKLNARQNILGRPQISSKN